MPDEILPCPKCGSRAGWSGPRYGEYWTRAIVSRVYTIPPEHSEWIGYACLTCGFERREPTKDAPLGPPTDDATRRYRCDTCKCVCTFQQGPYFTNCPTCRAPMRRVDDPDTDCGIIPPSTSGKADYGRRAWWRFW